MKKETVLVFVLKIAFSTAILVRQRIKRSDIELNYLDLSAAQDPYDVSTHYFVQKKSHFSSYRDEGTWLQRYAVNAAFYRKSGPAFLYLRSTSPMNEGREFPEPVLTYAKHLNAICFALENRFYGRTRPDNTSFRHLNTAEIVSDISNFIKGVPTNFYLSKNITWVVFGTSFGGLLGVYTKRTYPNLIHAVIASSSPLYAKVDYYEYHQVVEEAFKSYDSNCIESIKLAFEKVANFVISPENVEKMGQMFDIDEKWRNDAGFIKTYILEFMLRIISEAVQNNDATPLNISLVCRIIAQNNGKEVEGLAEIRKIATEGKEFHVRISREKRQDHNSAIFHDWEIAWKYQLCSEYGHFWSYTNVTFLSGVKHLLNSIEKNIAITCKRFFGPDYSVENLTERVEYTNSLYGGLNYNVGNTLFIHGSLDPWRLAGLYQKSKNSLFEVILIKGTSHCADMLSTKDKDSSELKNARNTILNTLKKWLEKN